MDVWDTVQESNAMFGSDQWTNRPTRTRLTSHRPENLQRGHDEHKPSVYLGTLITPLTYDHFWGCDYHARICDMFLRQQITMTVPPTMCWLLTVQPRLVWSVCQKTRPVTNPVDPGGFLPQTALQLNRVLKSCRNGSCGIQCRKENLNAPPCFPDSGAGSGTAKRSCTTMLVGFRVLLDHDFPFSAHVLHFFLGRRPGLTMISGFWCWFPCLFLFLYIIELTIEHFD